MMKNLIFVIATLLMFSFSGVSAQTVVKKPTPAHVTKDGKPDRRYKENKGVKAPGPLKKDGTPDKRFKSNKQPGRS